MSSTLQLRRRPTQERSAATFDHVLDTAARLLEREGWDGFTTNTLAQDAGIGVQTLYRYFPNKQSVVAALAERMTSEWDSWFEDVERFFPDAGTEWESALLHFVQKLRSQPGGVAIRKAMGASPLLRELDHDINRRVAQRFAAALERRCPGLDRAHAEVTMRVSTEASFAVVDLCFDLSEEEALPLLHGCMEMQRAYMQQSFPHYDWSAR